MALSHFSCQTGTGRGSIASWAAFRTCLRVLQKVFNNLVVQNSSILFTFNELSTAFLCAYMWVYAHVYMWMCCGGGLVVGWRRQKKRLNLLEEFRLLFIPKQEKNLPISLSLYYFSTSSAWLFSCGVCLPHLNLCSPSTDLNQIPICPKSEAERLTQSIHHKYLGTWWNLNLTKGD